MKLDRRVTPINRVAVYLSLILMFGGDYCGVNMPLSSLAHSQENANLLVLLKETVTFLNAISNLQSERNWWRARFTPLHT